MNSPILSIVTPAYNEAENLPILYKRLTEVFENLDIEWEWIIVDDHSHDGTFDTVTAMANKDSRIRGIRLARNFGSHKSIVCGVHRAKGRCLIVMAADLQDPPEIIPDLLEKWQNGAQVVWAVRRLREGEKSSKERFSKLYYFLMRRMAGIKEMPASGADFFLLDKIVIDAFRQFSESNTSFMALITWMGFRQELISYDKQSRQFGRSGWNLEKKLKLFVDSITSFTYLPIRFISYLGMIVALIGFIYAGWVIVNAIKGNPIQGWSSLMLVVLVIGGFQMIMMGILGEYLWRALDESRRRPTYLIERTSPMDSDSKRSEEHLKT